MELTPETKPLWTKPLKLGLISAMLGIAAGVVLSVYWFDHGAELFSLPALSSAMLPPMFLGLLSIVLAVYALIEGDRVKQPLMVFGVGILAIASPYFMAVAAVALMAAVVLAVFAALSQG